VTTARFGIKGLVHRIPAVAAAALPPGPLKMQRAGALKVLTFSLIFDSLAAAMRPLS
jgi:hypothetical protein